MAGRYVWLVLAIGLLSAPGCSSGPADNHDITGADTSGSVPDAVADVADFDLPVTPDVARDGLDPTDSTATPDDDTLHSVCVMCFDDSDCSEGFACVPIDGAKVCSCVDDGDCRNGFSCNPYGTPPVNVCVPEPFVCPSCSFQSPCADGKCCDMNTGSCMDCLTECQACENDFQCAPGSRCFVMTGLSYGVCLAECTDGVCGDTLLYTCQSRGSGVEVCVPADDTCPACTRDRPIRLPDGTCVQCVDDDDCVLMYGSPTLCNELHRCESFTPCDGLCTYDFPVCTVIDGKEQCVRCVDDDDCQAQEGGSDCICTGEPLFACVNSYGGLCGEEGDCVSTCSDSGDCPPGPEDTTLDCVHQPDLSYGFCVDPSGHCDGGSSRCCGAGQACYDLLVILQEIYPTVPRLIVGPDVTLTYCGCGTADDCLAGGPCTELSILCSSGDFPTEGLYEIICPDGQLHEYFPDRLCVQPATLLEYFGVVPAT